MDNLNKNALNFNEKSIYYELKKFYDINQGGLYSYQDLETAGIMEFKVVCDKVMPLKEYEKNRLAYELIKMLQEIVNNDDELLKIDGYLTLNPIINYYENFIKQLNVLKDTDVNISKKLSLFMKKMILNSISSKEIKLGLISATVLNIEGIENILDVFSIHNEYIFYVVKVYEYMKNGNLLIFELAKKSKGYGKVFCVKALQPIDFDMKSWMIKYGSQNNVAVSELLVYTMISLDLLDYLENNEFDETEIELFSKSFCMLLSDYGLEYINNAIKVYKKLLEIIDSKGKGIYSLYAVVSIIFSIEYVFEYYKSKKTANSITFVQDYKEIIKNCEKIYKKSMWSEVIFSEISNIEIETSVLISCIEKTKYKLRKNEFELILKRDYSNPLLYKYAFAIGSKAIKKFAFKSGLKNLPISELLSGQDELKIDDLVYEDIAHICFFIIIKYSKYEDFSDEYKGINLEALRSPLIETRMQAVTNIESFKGELDSLDEEAIENAISKEMVSNIRRRLNSLLIKKEPKEKTYVEVKDIKVDPNVKDIYLTSVNVAGIQYIDISEVYNKLFEDDVVYLKREPNNSYDTNAIQVVTTEGYVLGYIPRNDNVILKNLIDSGKYIYGIIKIISNSYEDIKIEVYLSYTDILYEIKDTLLLLSKGKEDYLQ